MITLLGRILIPDRENTADPAVRAAWGKLCGGAGIGLNLLLFAVKLAAGLLSGSIAIMADALNNLSDAGSSIITLLGFSISGKRPDSGHPFGHGRAEYISGLLVSMIIILVAANLIRDSVIRVIYPEETVYGVFQIAVLAASVAVKLYMWSFYRRVGRKIGSVSLAAASADSVSDVAATGVVLACAAASRFTGVHLDGWAGLVVGVFIFYSGIRAAKDTIDPLLGGSPDPALIRRIHDIVNEEGEIMGFHDLTVHDYGAGRLMISLHAEVPGSGELIHMHDVIDRTERRLEEELCCEAVIHMDPVQTDYEIDILKARLRTVLDRIDASILFHDFRTMESGGGTLLHFDLLVPYDYSMPDEELTDLVQEYISRFIGPQYSADIRVDKSYADRSGAR